MIDQHLPYRFLRGQPLKREQVEQKSLLKFSNKSSVRKSTTRFQCVFVLLSSVLPVDPVTYIVTNIPFSVIICILPGMKPVTLNPIYTTEKIGKARTKIGKGNFHFRQGKGKMCSVNSESLSCLANLFFGFGITFRSCPVLEK